MRARIPFAIFVIQSILILIHLALYETWAFFWGTATASQTIAFPVALAILSISFVTSSLLAYRYFNWFLRVVYTISAVWLGLVNFFFLAACACWVVYLIPRLFGVHLERPLLAAAFFGLGLILGIYSVVNAARTRVKQITIKLPNLPGSWRGRSAALVSDLHLGHLRNRGFLRRIVRTLVRLKPDVLFIPGDLFDGTAIDLDHIGEDWSRFSAPLGSYFVAGNHEQFSSPNKYVDVVRRSGIRVLENEKIILDGLQIVGVHYLDSTHVGHFQSLVKRLDLDRNVASVLLVHTPDRMKTAEEEGFSLQLSGHTHRGQFFPFTLIVSRIYREFAYGLNYFGGLAVYTSSGAGTWGPPMRLGSNPEIVLIHFE